MLQEFPNAFHRDASQFHTILRCDISIRDFTLLLHLKAQLMDCTLVFRSSFHHTSCLLFFVAPAGATVSAVTVLSCSSSAIAQRRPSLMSEHSSRRPSKPSSVSSTSGACPLWCLVCVRRHRARSSQLRNVKLTMSCVGISYTSGTCRLGVWFVYAAPPCAFSAVEKFKAHDVECL